MKQKPEEISAKEIQTITLRILKHFADFCEKNDINYILSDGTLLGAVRHKGFIPWDDDIDISMLRSDYEKFIRLWNDTEEYALVCHEKNKKIFRPYAKVVDMTMIAFQNGECPNKNSGLWIDIFPLDAIPNSDEERIKYWTAVIKKYEFFRIVYNCYYRSNNFVTNFLRRIKWTLQTKNIKVLFYTTKKAYNDLFLMITKFNESEHDNVTNNVCISPRPENRKYGFSKTVVTDYEYAQFETEKFRIPKDYDSLLKSYYNNYMKLPPENERVPAHKISVIYKSNYN